MAEWKFIPDCEGNYKVSSDGEIYSVPRRGTAGKIMKLHLDKWGYLYTGIRVKGCFKCIYAHRAVALAFIPNKENKPQVNHKNGIKTDNRVDNLEWVTQEENCSHSHRIGLHDEDTKRRSKPVIATNLSTGETIEYQSAREAARQLGISQGTISAIAAKGFTGTRTGYRFRYKEGKTNGKEVSEH